MSKHNTNSKLRARQAQPAADPRNTRAIWAIRQKAARLAEAERQMEEESALTQALRGASNETGN